MLLNGQELMMALNSKTIIEASIKLLKRHKIKKLNKEFLKERYALTLEVIHKADLHYRKIQRLKG